VLDRLSRGAMKAGTTGISGGGRVSLGTSGWNEWRPIHLSRVDLLGYAMWPFVVVIMILRPELYPFSAVLVLALSLVVIRNQQKPFFNSTHVHARRGWLGLERVAVPLALVDDVVVEPVRAFPGMGTINIRYGLNYLEFQCVPEADEKAELLRKAVEQAVARERAK